MCLYILIFTVSITSLVGKLNELIFKIKYDNFIERNEFEEISITGVSPMKKKQK